MLLDKLFFSSEGGLEASSNESLSGSESLCPSCGKLTDNAGELCDDCQVDVRLIQLGT